MTGTVADFKAGDVVNVKRHGRWNHETWTVKNTWWTTDGGRQYEIQESGETFAESDIRLHRGPGRPRFDPAAPTQRTTIRLTQAQAAKAKSLGNGNVAQGVRNALEAA